MLVYDICGATHQGRVRQQNEDHILVGRFVKNSGQLLLSFRSDDDFVASYGLLLCVADGIGSAAGGKMASRLALLTLEMGIAVIVEAILSFVNLSISTDSPTWGGMIAEGRISIHQAWWVLVFPLIALFLTVLSFSQLGEGLKDRFDPVLR